MDKLFFFFVSSWGRMEDKNFRRRGYDYRIEKIGCWIDYYVNIEMNKIGL